MMCFGISVQILLRLSIEWNPIGSSGPDHGIVTTSFFE